MSNHVITVTNADHELRADTSEITAEFGDTIELVNNSSLKVKVKFCLVDSNDRVIECPSELGPLAAQETHSDLPLPRTSAGPAINAIHVVAGDSWPKITVRPINSTSR